MTSNPPSGGNVSPANTEETGPADPQAHAARADVPLQRVRPRDIGRAAVTSAVPPAMPGAAAPAVTGTTEDQRGHLGIVERMEPGVLRIVAGVVLTAVVLATVGYFTVSASPQYTATALVSVRPDVSLLGEPTTISPDMEDRFVHSQLLTLNSRQLRNQVAQELAPAGHFSIDASQVGKSSVVQITATATSAQVAERVADTATNVYEKTHVAEVRERARAAQVVVDQQISRVRNLLRTAGPAAGAERNALETEYARLLSLSNQVSVAGLQADQTVASVETARTAGAELAVSPARRAAMLGLFGIVAALGAAIVWRRLSSRIHSVATVEELGLAPLLPGMPRAPRRWQRDLSRKGPPRAVGRAVRLQVAQLMGGSDTLARPPLCVISAESGAGTSFTAVNLAVEVARRHPALLVCAAELMDQRTYDDLGISADGPNAAAAPDETWTDISLTTLARRTRIPGLFLLPVGAMADQYVGAVRSPLEGARHQGGASDRAAANGLMEALAVSDWECIVDCPPLGGSRTGLDLAARAGKVVFVVGLGVSTQGSVVDSVRTLRRTGVTVSGVIVNRPRRI